jgi:hypothetical protein
MADAEKSDVRDRLKASTSYRTQQAEQEVWSIFQDYGWQAHQGVFYKDLQSGKMRELDVVATQFWSRELANRSLFLQLKFLIEVKSISNYHLLFPIDYTPHHDEKLLTLWMGEEGIVRNRFLRAVAKRGTPPVGELAALLHNAAYPGEVAVISPFNVTCPPTFFNASSFRETNIGGEKDLDNSVLWRAGLTLRSAYDSIREQRLRIHVENLVVSSQPYPGGEADIDDIVSAPVEFRLSLSVSPPCCGRLPHLDHYSAGSAEPGVLVQIYANKRSWARNFLV